MQENPCSIGWFVFKLLSFSMTVRGWSQCAVACWWNLKSCCVLVKIPGTSHRKTLAIPCTSATYDARNAHPAVPEGLHGTDGREALSFVPASHSAPAVQLRSRVARHASMRDSEGNKAWKIVEPFGSGKPRWLLRETVLSYVFSEKHWNVNVGFKKNTSLWYRGFPSLIVFGIWKTLCGLEWIGFWGSNIVKRLGGKRQHWVQRPWPNPAEFTMVLGAGNVWKKITNHH